MFLEPDQAQPQGFQRVKIVWSQGLPLNNGKVDLNLIQPTCMHWTVHGHQMRVLAAESRNTRRCAVRGSIVHYPENSTGFFVGGSAHHLIDKPIERSNTAFLFAPAEQFGSMHVQRCQVGPGATTFVFVFNLHRRTRLRGKRTVATTTCLDAGFFVRRQNKLVFLQALPVPNPFVEVENAPCLLSKMRISREDPTTMLPGSNRILVQPPPYRCAADRCYTPRLNDRGREISRAPSRKRHTIGRWQLARKRFNLDDQVWGKKPGDGPGADAPQGRQGVSRRIFFAIARRPLVGFRDDGRFLRYQCLLRPAGSFWRAVLENTATYISEPVQSVPAFHQRTMLSDMGCVLASQASSSTSQDATLTTLESIRIR